MGLNDSSQIVCSSDSHFACNGRLIVVVTCFDNHCLPEPELLLQAFLQIRENAHDGTYSDANDSLVARLVYKTLNLLSGEAKPLADLALGHVLFIGRPLAALVQPGGGRAGRRVHHPHER